MDEIFHIPQTRQFCQAYRQWISPNLQSPLVDTFSEVMNRYDPKITTPPGLYALAAPFAISVIGDPDCSAHTLRSINVLFQTGTFILLVATCHVLSPRDKTPAVMHSRLRATLVGAVLATSPVHCFTGFLFYTDPASTFFVLLVHFLTVSERRHEYRPATFYSSVFVLLRHTCTAFASVLAIACRQNNVVWVAFCMGVRILKYVENMADGRARATKEETIIPAARSLSDEFKRLAGCMSSRRWLFETLVHPATPSSLWPFLVAISAFVYSFVKNGYSVVLGDKSNHQPVFHLCQLLYFGIITGSVFSLDWFVSRRHGFKVLLTDMFWSKGRRYAHAAVSSIFVATCALAVRFANPTHRFMLADNRHYIFYIWRKTGLANKEDGILQYIYTPVYAVVWWGVLRRLREPAPVVLPAHPRASKQKQVGSSTRVMVGPFRSWFWILGFLLCTSMVLVPAHLVEFRYFIIPSLIVQIHLLSAHLATARKNGYQNLMSGEAVPIGTLLFTLLMHVIVNAATVYVFVRRGFRASDGSFSRFMW